MKLKHPLNGALHFIGAIASIVGLVFLMVFGHSDAWKTVSFAIYGSSLIILYTASTLYHWLPKESGGKYQIFRKIDHLSIYFLIAGTYTPFCLVTLRGVWGWSLFGTIWGLALLGILIQSIYINAWRWLTTSIYIGMGWLIVIAIKPLLVALPPQGFAFLAWGGLVYSIGGVVYTLRKPNISKHFDYHALWHTLVLAGSILHYLVIFFYIAIR